MLPLLAASANECVDALVLGGFTVIACADDATKLRRGLRVVNVPRRHRLLPAETLSAVLGEAGVSYIEFLELLADVPPEPTCEPSATGIRRRHLFRDTG